MRKKNKSSKKPSGFTANSYYDIPVNVYASGFNDINYQTILNNTMASVSGMAQLQNLYAQAGGAQQMPARKFKDHDQIVVTDPSNKHVGSTGTIIYYDEYNSTYAVLFVSSGEQRQFKAGQLELASNMPKPADKVVDFDSVIIEDTKKKQIIEALEQVNQADLIFNVWGFGKTMEKGKGVSMLFFGPPGTGKTLMGQAIADKLKYTLRIVSVADVETAEPGGAERNLRAIFEKATKETILFFDECDSLIFDRAHSGVIMGATVNQLLTSLENFDGVTIFTTNRLETLDEAVNRRLALKLEFNMPTAEHRALIWQRMMPEEAPVAKDVDWNKLAKVELAGGHIKNAVLRAARIAAAEDMADSEKQITMQHLVRALQEEGYATYHFQKAKANFNRPTLSNNYGQMQHTGGSLQIQRSMDILKQSIVGGDDTADE